MRRCLIAAVLAGAAIVSGAHAAALSEAEAKGFKLLRTDASDDYEDAAKTREGNPQIFRAPVSNGLLENTGQAKYSTTGDALAFGFKKRHFFTPQNETRVFAYGFRLYALAGGKARIVCTSPTSEFSVNIATSSNETFLCQIVDIGRKPGRFELPMSALPADVMLYARRDGGYAVLATSLADGGVRKAFGDVGFFREEFADGFDICVKLEPDAGKTAEMTIDNLIAGVAISAGASAAPAAFVKPEKEFDPAKAGWKKVFEDDFEGTQLDMEKWWFAPWAKNPEKKVALDGEGHLAIKCDFIPGTTNLTSGGIWSARAFSYGFAEAKVKFTKNNGWWAAFWLYGRSNTNPGVDGSEIDIFEDYYTRAAKPGAPNRPILDHNLHISVGKALQSWQYRSELPGTLDDWYVIGCKWTPFEISYYVNGKLMKSHANHSPYDGVVFDARNHAAMNAPLHILFSGCIMRGWGRRDTTGCTFPEFFKIDYVRYWEYPQDDPALPRIAWKDSAEGDRVMVPPGGKVTFEATVSSAPATKAPIKEALLFDCGHPVAVRTAPPWKFEIPFTEEYYRTTRYMAPGRSGKSPPWDTIAHAFRLYVRDAEGRIASADGVRWRIPLAAGKGLPALPTEGGTDALLSARPYKGKAHALPSTILPWQFDEGGRGVGHHSLVATPRKKGPGRMRLLRDDTAFDCRKATVMQMKSGEWMNYTVDVATGGTFRATLKFGTGNNFPNKVLLLVDGVQRGEFDCPWPGKWSWETRTANPIEGINLPSGRHVITLMPVGYLSVGTLTFATVP